MKHGVVLVRVVVLNAKVLPEQDFRASQCLNPKVCIWPEVSVFFDVGVRLLLIPSVLSPLLKGLFLWIFPGGIFVSL
jgi:hypothetical protein